MNVYTLLFKGSYHCFFRKGTLISEEEVKIWGQKTTFKCSAWDRRKRQKSHSDSMGETRPDKDEQGSTYFWTTLLHLSGVKTDKISYFVVPSKFYIIQNHGVLTFTRNEGNEDAYNRTIFVSSHIGTKSREQ